MREEPVDNRAGDGLFLPLPITSRENHGRVHATVIRVNAGLARVATVMKDFPGPWGIAGGWAIDLFIQRESRPHADIDVAILRGDQRHIHPRLPTGRPEKVVDRRLVPWLDDEELHSSVFEIHATWPDGFHLEVLLNDHDEARREWLFRRDHRIRRPLATAFVSGIGATISRAGDRPPVQVRGAIAKGGC